jgi:SPX domain protein involved in polyphosphate accumulation
MKFINGEYKMEKSIAKLEKQSGKDSAKVTQFRQAIDDIQNFVKENQLAPMVRANYSRMAFEIPVPAANH